ncbi:hydroxymethylbilane synthase [Enterococcus montenegrensis]|uniref:hydroxymethylbilane synthase n=1 Tax=Enterococcus montenegrensis TaxID=3031993 RepID=UPI00249D8CED|nr:hydroxymethylbilane synthase [Enterococcus montenegrensis]WHA08785.1 hydroxymethylbilane synthase [Enterococcus montenegrensis]
MDVKIGTRKSPLAQIQTDNVIARLQNLFPEHRFLKVLLTTTGDKDQTTALSQMAGQGVFVKTIQQKLLTGEIDLAVHSAKDLPSTEPEGLTLAAFPERAPAGDALILRNEFTTLTDLPEGAVIGTGSLRRQFQLLSLRPDFMIKSLRGNIDTRLKKLAQKEYDGIMMAQAALLRHPKALGDFKLHQVSLTLDEFLPAVGQGVIAVEAVKNSPAAKIAAAIDDKNVRSAITCERAFLSVFGVGCNVPLAAHAKVIGEKIELSTMLGSKTGASYSLVQVGANPVILGQNSARALQKLANWPLE